MKSFTLWLKEANSNIVITYDNMKKALNGVAEKYLDSVKERHYQVSVFNPEAFLKDIQSRYSKYPLLPNLIKALQSKNEHYIFDQQNKLRQWINNQPYDRNLRDPSRQIWTYIDYLSKNKLNHEQEEAHVYEMVKKTIVGTEAEMTKIKKMIEESINRISNWNNSPIIIDANYAEDETGIIMEAGNSAHVHVGSGEMSPSFSLFQIEGKIVIDDVIDGGDEDFFKDHRNQADYFNLINELKKPGSTNKGKLLTLYTARPKKDRQHYLSSNHLPVNVFLSNDYNHVEGLAIDLGGDRDIWKVRIDSRYLTQTLDGPVKYYQVTADNAPAKMELIS